MELIKGTVYNGTKIENTKTANLVIDEIGIHMSEKRDTYKKKYKNHYILVRRRLHRRAVQIL